MNLSFRTEVLKREFELGTEVFKNVNFELRREVVKFSFG